MNLCCHKTIVLLPVKRNVLRCVKCHLTIRADELKGKHCPECFEEHGQKNFDFEELKDQGSEEVRYRCEDCGIIIGSGDR